MEEILASIRRIISEEDQPQEEPVLELNEPAEEEVLEEPAFAAPPPPVEDMEPVDDVLVFEDAPKPEPVMAQEPEVEPPADPILSMPATTQAAHALSRLAGSLRISESKGQTLEGVVQELLKPMLREWLDAHLAEIVEAKVEAELERIARLAR